eukprot:TRINITY_DN2486_c0_g1_i4.p2 TRINITY_DN2486_c0_g1~~TRINITY_DN2486_c0_g1_i4.p2  ORF type:complete len:110 (+),score=16.00 TRINITY_DN2486_c0_g1_i4:248-577(+)
MISFRWATIPHRTQIFLPLCLEMEILVIMTPLLPHRDVHHQKVTTVIETEAADAEAEAETEIEDHLEALDPPRGPDREIVTNHLLLLPLLPDQPVSQFQCGWSSSQTSY